MNIEILINKENVLDKNYIPSNLIETDQNENNFHNFVNPTLKPMICKEIYPYFLKIQEDMKRLGLNIIIDSGYRSYDYQQEIWDQNVATKGLEETKKFVAPPGESEHQTGLAFDMAVIRNNQFIDGITEDFDEFKWMINHSYKYGFILRYPKGKESITGYNFEPWHFRFVGIRLAYIIHEFNITLEEYYEKKEYYDDNIQNKVFTKS